MNTRTTIIRKALAASDEFWKAWHRPDVCVAACRALHVAMREVGINLEPMVARARFLNQLMFDAFDNGLLDTFTPEQRAAWMEETGAWGVGLGYLDPKIQLGFEPMAPNSWGKHLALIDRTGGLLIDPSAGQASRPQKKIVVPQTVVIQNTPAEFLAGRSEGSIQLGATVASYRLFPAEDGSWSASPDWRDPKRFKGLVKKIIKAVR